MAGNGARRRRAAEPPAAGQAGPAFRHPPLPLAEPRADPRHAGAWADALAVNWLEIEIVNKAGKTTYRNSFVTDLAVTADNVAELAACGRARWKIENEAFQVRKTKGYHLEHNFGHGSRNLAALLATMNLLAFAFHTVCDLVENAWQDARRALGPRIRFFEHLRTVTVYHIFPDWAALIRTLVDGEPPPVRAPP